MAYAPPRSEKEVREHAALIAEIAGRLGAAQVAHGLPLESRDPKRLVAVAYRLYDEAYEAARERFDRLGGAY